MRIKRIDNGFELKTDSWPDGIVIHMIAVLVIVILILIYMILPVVVLIFGTIYLIGLVI